jgi:hypothetical protein
MERKGPANGFMRFIFACLSQNNANYDRLGFMFWKANCAKET